MNTSLMRPRPAHILTAGILLLLGGLPADAQLSLSGTSYTESFDTLGSGIPTGWTVRTGATSSGLGTATTLGTGPNTWGDTAGAFKNLASATGLTSTATTTVQGS